MDVSSIDPHLDPDARPLQLDPVTVSGPLDAPDPRFEPVGDFMDRRFEAAASFFEVILSPMASMAPTGGPMKATPASASARANSARSERKPYPGCTASAPVSRQASTIRSISR